jgi:hypothetical protein
MSAELSTVGTVYDPRVSAPEGQMPRPATGENTATDAKKGWLNKKGGRESNNLGGKVL